jgi:hypothetical protein
LVETSIAGAMVQSTFTARDIAWIAERGPGHGMAKVYIDGSYVSTIDLDATTDQARRVVFARHYSSVGTHTIRVVGLATIGRPVVDVDGFLYLR